MVTNPPSKVINAILKSSVITLAEAKTIVTKIKTNAQNLFEVKNSKFIVLFLFV